jgi:hypothetical protein
LLGLGDIVALAVNGLTATTRAAFDVAANNMKKSLVNAAIVTWLFVRAPILRL